VADTSKQISKSYGVLVEDENDDMYGAALRGLFIIDPTGKVRSLTINDDAAGRNVDEAIRTITAFQYAATHAGEVCPASWKPGQRTIKASPDGIKDYFISQEKDL
jgi:peroxiredoxin (alkyl hydroperoxide reductase subunit C)